MCLKMCNWTFQLFQDRPDRIGHSDVYFALFTLFQINILCTAQVFFYTMGVRDEAIRRIRQWLTVYIFSRFFIFVSLIAELYRFIVLFYRPKQSCARYRVLSATGILTWKVMAFHRTTVYSIHLLLIISAVYIQPSRTLLLFCPTPSAYQ